MARTKQTPQTKLCEAALRLAAKAGWRKTTFEQIAVAAKIPFARARTVFPDKNDILPAIMCMFDERTAHRLGKVDSRSTPRDRLFEVLMARFDVLQEHRAGVLAIVNDSRCEPSMAKSIIPAQIHSLQHMITLARLTQERIPEPLVTVGLAAVYYRALWVWQKDMSADMSKTMAAVDKGLQCVSSLVDILFRKQ